MRSSFRANPTSSRAGCTVIHGWSPRRIRAQCSDNAKDPDGVPGLFCFAGQAVGLPDVGHDDLGAPWLALRPSRAKGGSASRQLAGMRPARPHRAQEEGGTRGSPSSCESPPPPSGRASRVKVGDAFRLPPNRPLQHGGHDCHPRAPLGVALVPLTRP